MSKEQTAMSEHTEGPLTAEDGDGYSIWRLWIGKLLIAQVIGDSAETDANARRIVAAWNACAGIETKTLESDPFNNVVLHFSEKNQAEARAAKAERLLSLSVKAHEAMCDWLEFELGQSNLNDDGVIAGAREAIANVRAFLEAKP